MLHNGQSVQAGDVSIRAEDIQSLDIVKTHGEERNGRSIKSQQLEDEISQTKVKNRY